VARVDNAGNPLPQDLIEAITKALSLTDLATGAVVPTTVVSRNVVPRMVVPDGTQDREAAYSDDRASFELRPVAAPLVGGWYTFSVQPMPAGVNAAPNLRLLSGPGVYGIRFNTASGAVLDRVSACKKSDGQVKLTVEVSESLPAPDPTLVSAGTTQDGCVLEGSQGSARWLEFRCRVPEPKRAWELRLGGLRSASGDPVGTLSVEGRVEALPDVLEIPVDGWTTGEPGCLLWRPSP
jgi:hypothetical protein